jgi:hypothetical protein
MPIVGIDLGEDGEALRRLAVPVDSRYSLKMRWTLACCSATTMWPKVMDSGKWAPSENVQVSTIKMRSMTSGDGRWGNFRLRGPNAESKGFHWRLPK